MNYKLKLKKIDFYYYAVTNEDAIMLNHLVGEDHFYETLLETVIKLAKMHGWTIENESQLGY